MAEGQHIYFCDSACRITLWESLTIFDIAGPLDAPHMLQLEAAMLRVYHERNRAIGVLALLRASAPVPLAPARQQAVRILKTYDWIAQVAVVCEGTGVGTQMLKAVVRSVKMLAGASRLAIIDTLDDAEAQLFTRILAEPSGSLSLDQLKRALRSILSDYAPLASEHSSR